MRKYLCNRLGEKTNFEVVALAASLGGIGALMEILSGLPADFPIPIIIAQHLYSYGPTMLAKILSRITVLPVKEAEEGDKLSAGRVFFAPPNHHLKVNQDQTLSLLSTPRVNYCRPSADVLFTSVADVYREKSVGVVLTG